MLAGQGSAVPVAHAVHVAVPVALAKEPGRQGKHTGRPAVSVYRPARTDDGARWSPRVRRGALPASCGGGTPTRPGRLVRRGPDTPAPPLNVPPEPHRRGRPCTRRRRAWRCCRRRTTCTRTGPSRPGRSRRGTARMRSCLRPTACNRVRACWLFSALAYTASLLAPTRQGRRKLVALACASGGAPSLGAKVPAAQGWHVVSLQLRYVPAAHLVHWEEPALATHPSRHALCAQPPKPRWHPQS